MCTVCLQPHFNAVGLVFLDETLKRKNDMRAFEPDLRSKNLNPMAERESISDSGIELRNYNMDNVETSSKEPMETLYKFNFDFDDIEDNDEAKSPPHEVAVAKTFTNLNERVNFEDHGHHGERLCCVAVHKNLPSMVAASVVPTRTCCNKFKYTPGRKVGLNNFCDLIMDRRVILSTVLYGLTSFIGVISEEVGHTINCCTQIC